MAFLKTVNKGRRAMVGKSPAVVAPAIPAIPGVPMLPAKITEPDRPIFTKELGNIASDLNYRDNSYLHASELADYCPRRAAIVDAFGVVLPAKLDPHFQLLMTFELGTAAHERLQNVLLARSERFVGRWECLACGDEFGEPTPSKWVVRPEKCPCGSDHIWFKETTFMDEELGIGGSLDGGVLYPNGQVAGFEIKTISQKGFDNITKARGLKTRCLPENVLQAQMYMHLSGLPRQHFLYWSKGWHGMSNEIFETPTGFIRGPMFETYVDRGQAMINSVITLRRVELASKAVRDAGNEAYPKPLHMKGWCTTGLETAAKNCAVCRTCIALQKEGK